jgi:hypothetical protein
MKSLRVRDGRDFVTYRFYYLDEGGKVIDQGVENYSDKAEAIAIAELHMALTPHHAVEVWDRSKIICRYYRDRRAN